LFIQQRIRGKGNTSRTMDPIPITEIDKIALFRKMKGAGKDRLPIINAQRKEALAMIISLALTDLDREGEDRDDKEDKLIALREECQLLRNKNDKLEGLLNVERTKDLDNLMADDRSLFTPDAGDGGGDSGVDGNVKQDPPSAAAWGDDGNGPFTAVKKTGNGSGGNASGSGNANGSGSGSGNAKGNANGNDSAAKGKAPVCLSLMRGERCISCHGGYSHPKLCEDVSHVTRRTDCSLWHLAPNKRIHESKKAGGGTHNPRGNAKGNKSGSNVSAGRNGRSGNGSGNVSNVDHKLAAAKLQHRLEILEMRNKYLSQEVRSKAARPTTYAAAATPAGVAAPTFQTQFSTQQLPARQQMPPTPQQMPAPLLLSDIMTALNVLTSQVQLLQQQQN
jgi:hypothetical protein